MGREQKSPLKQKGPKQSNTFLKYSGLGLQMMFTIGIAGVLGYFIDQKTSLKFPVFLLLFMVMSLVGSIYLLMKNLPKE